MINQNNTNNNFRCGTPTSWRRPSWTWTSSSASSTRASPPSTPCPAPRYVVRSANKAANTCVVGRLLLGSGCPPVNRVLPPPGALAVARALPDQAINQRTQSKHQSIGRAVAHPAAAAGPEVGGLQPLEVLHQLPPRAPGRAHPLPPGAYVRSYICVWVRVDWSLVWAYGMAEVIPGCLQSPQRTTRITTTTTTTPPPRYLLPYPGLQGAVHGLRAGGVVGGGRHHRHGLLGHRARGGGLHLGLGQGHLRQLQVRLLCDVCGVKCGGVKGWVDVA